jgi:hypothetical protein
LRRRQRMQRDRHQKRHAGEYDMAKTHTAMLPDVGRAPPPAAFDLDSDPQACHLDRSAAKQAQWRTCPERSRRGPASPTYFRTKYSRRVLGTPPNHPPRLLRVERFSRPPLQSDVPCTPPKSPAC